MSEKKSPFSTSKNLNSSPSTNQIIEGVSPYSRGCSTIIQFPEDLIKDIRYHVVSRGLSIRELIRTVLERWIERHAQDMEAVKSGTINLTPLEDRRSLKGSKSPPENVVSVNIYLSLECHTRLKQVAAGKGATLRGVVVAILQEWNTQDPS